ncbi:hypothetical protein FOA52_010268 [Chlamydomonas sp. UWO 241]|nr:hypothetical protein FOA52_010268 [Chlamydomonas sp. UWO 241]
MTNALGLGNYGSDEEEEGPGILGLGGHSDDGSAEDAAAGRGGAAGGGAGGAVGDGGSCGREGSEPASTSSGSADNKEDADKPGGSAPGGPAVGGTGGGGRNSAAAAAAAATATAAIGPLSKLPPELQQPPEGDVDADLALKFRQLIARKRAGAGSFNDALRNHKSYRNPDLLTKLVEHNAIDQYGSAFDEGLFDPHGMPGDDALPRVLQQWERDVERKKAARGAMGAEQLRAGAGVEFARGGGGGSGGPPPGAPSAGGGLALASASASAALIMKQSAALSAALAVNGAGGALQPPGGGPGGGGGPHSKRTKWDNK